MNTFENLDSNLEEAFLEEENDRAISVETKVSSDLHCANEQMLIVETILVVSLFKLNFNYTFNNFQNSIHPVISVAVDELGSQFFVRRKLYEDLE